MAAIADVTIGPSPGWLSARLEATGIQPINNVVDITNYVMVEIGHPLHAFDLESLAQNALKIRAAKTGEMLRTLDGQERSLKPNMLVIADAIRPQAVAGIIGGADSGVSGSSRQVALESAYFLPNSIRRTSKKLALSTDASYRFERGADIGAPAVAMRRVLTLLRQTGAGRPRGPIIDRHPRPSTRTSITLRHARIPQVLGVDIEMAFVSRTLERLGFTVTPGPEEHADTCLEAQWKVTVPTHRVDVSREIDLIEEIARHYGYDRIPSTFPAAVQAPVPQSAWLRRQRLLRRVLTASGCSEAITYSFVENAAAAPFVTDQDDLVHIANPLSEKFTVLRPSLLPGLVDSLVRNRRREHRDVRVFEIGKRFRHQAGETSGVAVAITGAGTAEHWSEPERAIDFFDLKGIIERTCKALGVTPMFEQTDHQVLVPGRASTISATSGVGGHKISLGFMGQLTPTIATARGFPSTGDEVYIAELELTALESVAVDRDRLHVIPVPRHPSVVRDLALLVDINLPAAALRDTILATAPDTLVSVNEFDRYTGKGIPDGCVSLAFHLTFRTSKRTLTDVEVQTSVNKIVAALEHQHGAKLR